MSEICCANCGEDIRLIDGEWRDRETHRACEVLDAEGLPREDAPRHAPLQQGEDVTLVALLTAIVREADQAFEKVGGSSRHWVRECFLPTLNAHGYKIVAVHGDLLLQKDVKA